MKKISVLYTFLVLIFTGCAGPYTGYHPYGMYSNQYYGGLSQYGYNSFYQTPSVSIHEVDRNSKQFAVGAEKFHQNLTGMQMCANGGTKVNSAATVNGTVSDNSGRLNYQITAGSSTTEICKDIQMQIRGAR